MPGIDEQRAFVPVHIAVLTISDSRTEADDKSGDVIVNRLKEAGHTLIARNIVPDNKDAIGSQLISWIDVPEVDVVVAA